MIPPADHEAYTRPYALPAFDFVRATVENDRPLADAPVEVTCELLRPSGPR